MAQTLFQIFEEAEKEHPNSVFIIERNIYSRKSFTYHEILAKIKSISSFFHEKNIKKGDKILIFLPNSSDYASILLACACSGVIAVPIDFNSSIEFAKSIYHKVKAKLIFCSLFKKPEYCTSFFQEEIQEIYKKENKTPIKPAKITQNDIFEIVFTSGTTSEPKGVVLTNKNLISNIESLEKVLDFNLKDSPFLSILPLSHLFEQNIGFFLPILNESRIVYSQSRKSSSLIRAINEEKIRIIVSVPLFLSSIKEKIEFEAKKQGKFEKLTRSLQTFSNYPRFLKKIIFSSVLGKLGNLKYFFCGGAELDMEVEKFWNSLGITVLQGYGLTETSPVLTYSSKSSRKIGSVGTPIPGVELKIEKDNEILAKGDNIFHNYYENPEKTKEALKNGWFYTEDLGKFDTDGFLTLIGRKKNMILSSSGLNIYPEDIEKILNKLPDVKESAVLSLDNGKNLLAVVLSSKKLDTSFLLAKANTLLETNKKLSRIIQWPEEDFSRTSTRKIIRRRIEETLKEILSKKQTHETHEVKEKLIKILSELLETSPNKISEKTPLVSLGMDSIKRINLAIKIEETYDLEEFDEDSIDEKTTPHILRNLIEKSKENKYETGINFLNSHYFTPLRFVLQELAFGISSLFYSRKVQGIENLPYNGPVIFIANHVSILDTFSIFKSLPVNYRLTTYPAGAKDFFFEGKYSWLGIPARLLFNTFSFSRTSSIKQSLRDSGKLVSKGRNLLIYPEGTRSKTGKLLPFKPGIGILAWNLEVPIIPIKTHGLYEILPRDKIIPRRAPLKISIGAPLIFNKTQSPQEITKILEEEMKKLE